jgi:hypothetical protein
MTNPDQMRFHGLAARYNNGCRCASCRAANAARQRRRRAGVRSPLGTRSDHFEEFSRIVQLMTGDPDIATEIWLEMKKAGLAVRRR